MFDKSAMPKSQSKASVLERSMSRHSERGDTLSTRSVSRAMLTEEPTVKLNVRIQRRLRNVFNYFDYDDNGTMNVDEFVSLMKALSGGTVTTETMKAMLERQGLSSSVEMQFPEFVESVAMYYVENKSINTDAFDIFSIFDRSGTGIMTRADLKGTLAKLGEDVCDEEVEAMMAEAEADEGEGITEQSFYDLLYSLNLVERSNSEAVINVADKIPK